MTGCNAGDCWGVYINSAIRSNAINRVKVTNPILCNTPCSGPSLLTDRSRCSKRQHQHQRA